MAEASHAGIDVGGTKCLGVALDSRGEIVDEHRVATPSVADRLLDVLTELAERFAPIASLGVGVPGLVDRAGVLHAAPNLGAAAGLAVGPMLGERLGMAVRVDNDATCAAVAEWRAGAGRGHDDVVMVTLGTGIGGGVIAGGELQRGTNGFAGEIGHMVVDPAGPPCPCGRRGCWERYASGSGLGWLAGARRGEEVVDEARMGSAEALAVIERYAWWIALGLANLTNMLDPAAIVIGGGLVSAADVLDEPLRRAFAELLYAPSRRPHPELHFAELGEHAGAIGAAYLGWG